MSKGSSNSTTKTNTNSSSQPWAPTVPYLESFLGELNRASGNMGPTGGQLDAFSELLNNASGGNPWASNISDLASKLFGFGSNAGGVSDAQAQLQKQLGGYAAGDFVNPNTNPVEQQTLQSISDQVANKVNSEFAAAGRPAEGNAASARAMGEGITQAELPYLNSLYTTEQGMQTDAAKTLAGSGMNAAQLEQLLSSGALSTESGGVPMAGNAIQAENYAPNTVLNLMQQLEGLPFSDLAQYASLLLPTAGLGGQMSGNSVSNTSGSSSGINLGSGVGGSLLSAGIGALSDKRVKHNIKHVGTSHDGQKIYSFQYKDDPDQQTHMGLIAQEVEKDHPEAVGQTAGGIKTVDYDAALADAHKKKRRAS